MRVSQAYFDVLAAQDSLALVRAQKTAVAEQLASAKRNFEVGTSTITDTREAQARYDLVIAQEIAAENDLQVKKIALDQLVGRPGSEPDAAGRAGGAADAAAGRHERLGRAGRGRASRDPAGAARPRRGQARSATRPRPATSPRSTRSWATTSRNNPQRHQHHAPAASRVNAASVGVVFNLPLFAGFATENRIKETLALEEQSRRSSNRRAAAWRRPRARPTSALVSGAGQVKALEAAEASSQSALDANRLGYQVGVRINIDVLNSQSQLFQTKRDLALARYNVLLGNLKLRQANGTLTADDLQRDQRHAGHQRPCQPSTARPRRPSRSAAHAAAAGAGRPATPSRWCRRCRCRRSIRRRRRCLRRLRRR